MSRFHAVTQSSAKPVHRHLLVTHGPRAVSHQLTTQLCPVSRSGWELWHFFSSVYQQAAGSKLTGVWTGLAQPATYLCCELSPGLGAGLLQGQPRPQLTAGLWPPERMDVASAHRLENVACVLIVGKLLDCPHWCPEQ